MFYQRRKKKISVCFDKKDSLIPFKTNFRDCKKSDNVINFNKNQEMSRKPI